jgi:uncharacterized CHY-type Zn-finger protein
MDFKGPFQNNNDSMDSSQTYGCAHWKTQKDIISIKCPCHNKFLPCLSCHQEKYDSVFKPWPKDSWGEKAILCRACKTTLTITEYMKCNSTCPKCGAEFNPGCKNHWPLYFEIPSRYPSSS